MRGVWERGETQSARSGFPAGAISTVDFLLYRWGVVVKKQGVKSKDAAWGTIPRACESVPGLRRDFDIFAREHEAGVLLCHIDYWGTHYDDHETIGEARRRLSEDFPSNARGRTKSDVAALQHAQSDIYLSRDFLVFRLRSGTCARARRRQRSRSLPKIQ
jgi:hypothetical protein